MLRRALERLFAAAGHAAATCVLLIFVLMLVQSVGRGAGWRVGGINDVVSWLCAAAAFLAMAHAFRHGDFVRVTLLLEKLADGPRRALETAALLVAAVSTGYLAWWAASFAYDSYAFKEMAGGLVVIPIWIPQLSFVLGAVLLLLAVLDELWRVLSGQKPTYVRLVEERHARGDFSEDM